MKKELVKEGRVPVAGSPQRGVRNETLPLYQRLKLNAYCSGNCSVGASGDGSRPLGHFKPLFKLFHFEKLH